jgi:hypothetical protein
MPSRKSKNSRRRSRRASKSRKNARRGLRMRGGSLGSLVPSVFPPQVGSPYDATSTTNAPTGNFLSLSKVGIPSGGLYPPEPSNPQFSGGGRSKRSSRRSKSKKRSKRGGGRKSKRTKKSKRSSRRGMRSRGMRSRGMRSRGMRGGGLSMFMSSLLPDDVVNVGRSVPSAFEQLSDKFNGLISPASYQVYPTNQPLAMATGTTHSAVPIAPTNINAIYNNAAASVNGI